MTRSEQDVRDWLAKHELRAEQFTKREMRERKTPDFRAYRDEDFAFYCEVKEVAIDDWEGGARRDPIFNRLTTDIHTAVKQFRSVNPDHQEPNVLAFVNNDRHCGFLDLIAVTTGKFLADDESSDAIYQQFSEGRIRDEKFEVDLYLWLDAFKADQFHFNQGSEEHLGRLCQYFGVSADSIAGV